MPLVWLPLVAFGTFLAAHVALWRMPGRRGIVGLWPLSAVALGAYGLVSLCSQGIWKRLGLEWHWFGVPLFILLVMMYFNFYFGILRSVSVRFLGELYKLGGGPIPLGVLRDSYSYEDMLRLRLSSLEQAGWVSERGGRYTLTPRGQRVAWLAMWLKGLYRLEVSG